MLALQRPSMASSKPAPRRDMPFGYDFDAVNDFPFPPPPAPAPGPSLLDDADSKLLGDFFDGVSSDHFNGSDFLEKPLAMAASGAYELPFGWTQLPPTFMGTSSSFGGIQQQSTHGLQEHSFAVMGNSGMPAGASAEVLAAATLLRGHSHNFHDGIGNDMLAAQDISRTLQTGPSPPTRSRMHSMASFPTSRPTATTLPPKDSLMHDIFYSDMIFNDFGTIPRKSKAEDVQWGTDAGFSAASFTAPPGQESQRKVEIDMLKHLDCFAPKLGISSHSSSSTNTTEPSSPLLPRLAKENAAHQQTTGSSRCDDERESSLQPKKRRKSTAVKAEDDGEEDHTCKAPTRKRKQTQGPPKSSPADPSSSQAHLTATTSLLRSKRRKSAHAKSSGNSSGDGASKNNKSARENLTEDQKRENHIRSEQKRRTLIKEGFEDLGELVPELGGGGFSKSAVLLMAGDWLEDLVRGNEYLRGQLGLLEGRGGLG